MFENVICNHCGWLVCQTCGCCTNPSCENSSCPERFNMETDEE